MFKWFTLGDRSHGLWRSIARIRQRARFLIFTKRSIAHYRAIDRINPDRVLYRVFLSFSFHSFKHSESPSFLLSNSSKPNHSYFNFVKYSCILWWFQVILWRFFALFRILQEVFSKFFFKFFDFVQIDDLSQFLAIIGIESNW